MSSAHRPVERLVLVDDDHMEEKILRSYLRLGGATADLVVFSSGREFLEYMDRSRRQSEAKPDLVLLDIRMPGLDGFEVLSQLRSETEFEAEPTVIVFSNSNDEADAKKARGLGAEYQTKPSSGDDYLAFLGTIGVTTAPS